MALQASVSLLLFVVFLNIVAGTSVAFISSFIDFNLISVMEDMWENGLSGFVSR